MLRIFASIMTNIKKKLTDTLITAGTFGLLVSLTYYICAPDLCLLENTATYIARPAAAGAALSAPGGCAAIVALWLQQWFTTPFTAAVITGAVLAVISLSLDSVMRALSCSRALMPLSLIPAISLISAHTGIDYRLTATVAVAMVTICLLPVSAVSNAWARLSVSVAGCVVIFLAAGPASVLFSVITVMICLASDGKKGLYSLVCLPLTIGLGYLGAVRGVWSSTEMALLPWGYFPHWHHPVFTDLLSWISVAGVVLTAIIARFIIPASTERVSKSWIAPTLCGVITIGLAVWMVQADCVHRKDSFSRMWMYSSAHEWDKVTSGYKDVDKEDATMQNFMNLALAEKGTLCDYLFRHPNNGVTALHNTERKSPYTYMLLSDVYYSMGFIALAKRYAFEANEALGNSSPQMLMRLADTNIITGDYAVAAKYLDMLGRTANYSGWAGARHSLLYDDDAVAADPVLGMKRRCIFPDNRFAGSEGIADDMLQVLRCNPEHKSTMQYLGAYLMLSRNIPALVSVVEEFYGSPALKAPLPAHFQEALVVDGLINGNGIDARYNIHPSVPERCRAFWAEHKSQPNTLWQYLRTK